MYELCDVMKLDMFGMRRENWIYCVCFIEALFKMRGDMGHMGR